MERKKRGILPLVVIVVTTLCMIIYSMINMETEASTRFALCFSCVPAVILLVLIYRLDRIEQEPIGLMIRLFLLGVLSTALALIIELVISFIFDLFIPSDTLLYQILNAFVVAALTEEWCKYLFLKRATWNHPAFDFRFDAVVYATTVAIGFELTENLLYMIGSTTGTAVLRAAFPGHCIFGIYMGYYYGLAKTKELDGDARAQRALLRKCLLIPVLIHGFYDFCALSGSTLLCIVLFLLIIVLNVAAYLKIKRLAGEDTEV